MKAYVKQVQDAHSYYADTNRQKQSKVPKASGDRKGTKTSLRMSVKDTLRKGLES